MLVFPNRQWQNCGEKQIFFFSVILGLFVFNLRKYLFLFRNIMKMIGEEDSANEREKNKKDPQMLSWLCHRMLGEKWKSIFRVTAAGAWAVALPTSWEASVLEVGEEADFHTSQVWKRKRALWVCEKASFKMLQDIDRKRDPSQCPSSGECGISIHWIYDAMDIVWIYPQQKECNSDLHGWMVKVLCWLVETRHKRLYTSYDSIHPVCRMGYRQK